MSHEVFEQVPQGSRTPQDTEAIRIASIIDDLERVCRIHAPQCGAGQEDVVTLEVEQRAAEMTSENNRYLGENIVNTRVHNLECVHIQHISPHDNRR